MTIYLINGKELRELEDPFAADNLLRKGWQRGPSKPGEDYEWSTEKGCWVKKEEKPTIQFDEKTIAEFFEFLKSKEAQQ